MAEGKFVSAKLRKPRRATRIDVGWALHRGPIDDAKLHAHDALQISATRDQKIGVNLGESTIWASTVLILRGVRHAIHCPSGTTPTTLFLDPDSEAARGFAARASGLSVVVLSGPIELAVRNLMHSRFDDDDSAAEAFDNLTTIFRRTKADRPNDPRVHAALVMLVERHRQKWPLAGLAESAGMSIPQFARLFQKCTGLPVRTHVRWLRFQTAIRSLARHGDLSSAANDAGYLNALQFTAAFCRTFNLSPTVFADTLHPKPHPERLALSRKRAALR